MPRSFLLAIALFAAACGQRTVQLVPTAIEGDDPATDARMPMSLPDAGRDALVPEVAFVLCEDAPCACNDGQDNDGDGLVDGADPECTGPFDHDEASYGIGAPKSNAKCQDCFFDDNAASADDGCSYHKDCLDGDATGDMRCGCDVTSACINSCRARTPNGCDCFGCCHVLDAAGELHAVRLEGSCTQDKLADSKRCAPCERDEACVNPCGPCELCPGRDPASLPASCTGQGAPYQCDDGRVCGPNVPCGEDFYCLQGCCIPVVF